MLAFGAILIARNQPRRYDFPGDLLRAEFHLDARAFQLIDDRGKRLAFRDPEREFVQLLIERNAGIVAQARYFATLVVDGERLQNIVHRLGVEIEPRRFARGQRAGALKIADAVLVEHNGPHGQFGGG